MAQQDDTVKDTQSNPIPPLEEIFFLTISVESARDLIKADISGKSDPFCKVIATTKDTKQSWTTSMIEKELNPQWNEETSFVFFNPVEKIDFEVYDWDKNTKHDEIGNVCLKKGDFDYKDKEFDGELKLENVKKGYLKVKVAGRSIKPLELEERCNALQSEVEKQQKILSDKEAERQQAADTNAAKEGQKKELQSNVDTLQSQLDDINAQIEAQKKRNESKRAEIERLKKDKADLEGKIQSKRDQIESQSEKLKVEQKKLEETDQELQGLKGNEDE